MATRGHLNGRPSFRPGANLSAMVTLSKAATLKVSAMKPRVRYTLVFIGATIAGVCLHEVGHATAGWILGIAVVPTPAKEYILRPEVDWNQQIWVFLGGPTGTTLAMAGATIFFLLKRCPEAEAILLGAQVPLSVYNVRFLLVGRGHDGLEWQGAQAALGLAPAGHAIDFLYLSLWVVVTAVWIFRSRARLLSSLRRFIGLTIAGIIMLVLLQSGNNCFFDRYFPKTRALNVPSGLELR